MCVCDLHPPAGSSFLLVSLKALIRQAPVMIFMKGTPEVIDMCTMDRIGEEGVGGE